MEEKYYRIGEVSKITGISKDTLHFYDHAGLLTPAYIDPQNGYRYYSRLNFWQLDIITICKKLGVPLDKVRQIFKSHDNDCVTSLLMEYREEALRLSRYYQQAADDILWYYQENNQVKAARNFSGYDLVSCEYLPSETVIAGTKNNGDYHANLQLAARKQLLHTGSIRRRYGYFLDTQKLATGEMVKLREYVKIDGSRYEFVPPENLFLIPEGEYAVCRIHILDGHADFSPLIRWLTEHKRETDAVYAEEIGLQLFAYIDSYDCRVKAHLK